MTSGEEVSVSQSNRLRAAAASQRIPLDDADDPVDAAEERDPDVLDRDAVGMHVDGPDAESDEAEDDELDPVAEIDTDAIDAVAEAFNARDLDALLEVVAADAEAPGLLGGDQDGLAESVQGLWHRRPTCCMTRGRVDDVVVGVLWEQDGAAWWPLATVHVDDIDDEGRPGVLEFADDAGLLDEVVADPPDGDLEEGARWVEWEEGAD